MCTDHLSRKFLQEGEKVEGSKLITFKMPKVEKEGTGRVKK